MFSPDFAIKTQVTLHENDKCMLLDLDKIKDEKLCVIGTSARVYLLDENGGTITAEVYGAGDLNANIRLRVPFEVKEAFIDGEKCGCVYDSTSETVLVSFANPEAKRRTLIIK